MKFLLSLLLCFFYLSVYSQDWVEVEPVPAEGRDDAIAFALNGYGFIVTGNQGGFSESNRLWRYDPLTDSWTEKAPFPGEARQYAGSFVLQNEAYIVMGISSTNTPLNDVWKYNAAGDLWTRMHDFPGSARWSMFAFATLNTAYAGTGSTLTALLADTWKYDRVTDSWSQLNDFPGGTRRETISFSIGEKGFAGLGYATLGGSDFAPDFYEWNELSDSWKQLADFPEGRSYANAIGTNAFGYVGTGQTEAGVFRSDCLRFDPVSQEWNTVNDLPGNGIRGMSAFAIEDTPYFLTGIDAGFTRVSIVWKLTNPAVSEGPYFSCYPNPSNGDLIVKALNGSRIQLFTPDGKCLLETTAEQQQTVFLHDVPSGAYQLRVFTGETVYCQQLIVY